MGKAEANKQQKVEALMASAYELFMTQGIEQTTIHDIASRAGVAKGTFYLYFRDKYEVRDRLIIRTAERLFVEAYRALRRHTFAVEDPASLFEEQTLFLIDYVLEELEHNPQMLLFLSKNLSRGFFHLAEQPHACGTEERLIDYYDRLLQENPNVHLRNPEILLFLIVELAGSASFSTILEKDPIGFEELKPELYHAIRAIIRSFVVTVQPSD